MKLSWACCSLAWWYLMSAQALSQSLTAGTGVFTYADYSPLSNRPVQVFYHIPPGNVQDMPVLFAFHGEERDAENYRNTWIAAANQHKFMVVAPEFSTTYYPGGNFYNLGNVFTNGENPTLPGLQPDSVWTFSLIDPLFLHLKAQTGTSADGYLAFGHSAGAQFLHRFVIIKPQSLMLEAYCANAGWYTVPDANITFPYGLRISPVNEAQVKQAFAKRLTVMLGKLDNNPNAAGLRRNEQADAQGIHRLARGKHFFAQSQGIATNLQTLFNWRIFEVEGVGHSQSLMATNTLPILLQTSVEDKLEQPKVSIFYAEGCLQVEGLFPGEGFSLTAVAGNGQVVWNNEQYFTQDQKIRWHAEKSGIYIIKLLSATGRSAFVRIIGSGKQ